MEQSKPKEEQRAYTREEKLELEEKAIETLLSMGVKFSVPLKIKPRKEPEWRVWARTHLGWFKAPRKDKRLSKTWNVTTLEVPNLDNMSVETIYQRNFHIKPLYLGTIDYLRKLYIRIEYDEGKIQEDALGESPKLFQHTRLMAQIAAVAVINSPEVADPMDNRAVKDLTEFFLSHLTVRRLKKLSDTIAIMMDAEGFTNSIRLISVLGQTKPKNATRANLVE
jgi:hypothetical protein